MINQNGDIRIEIASFNVFWFGLGGTRTGNPGDEFRSRWIREFLDSFLRDSDVILFQEIVDVEALRELLGSEWQCVAPEPIQAPCEKKHHVVLALRNGLRFRPGNASRANDKHDASIELTFDKPDYKKRRTSAVCGVLESKSGQPLAYLVGVHFKAGRGSTNSDLRVAQARTIVKHLASGVSQTLPTVVLGDFNTWPELNNAFPVDSNGKSESDVALLNHEFASAGLTLVPNSFPMTFRHLGLQLSLDHMWVSDPACVEQTIDVCEMCKEEKGYIARSDRERFSQLERFDNFEFYNRYVSDHSPIKATFRFGPKDEPGASRDAPSVPPKRILMVLTSHHSLGDSGKHTGVWLEELAVPYMAFTANGYAVDLCSIKGGRVPIDPKSERRGRDADINRILDDFRRNAEANRKLDATFPVQGMSAEPYCAVVLPGGHGTMWDFRDNPDLRRVIQNCFGAGKVVAALCHGVAGLVGPMLDTGAPVVQGRRLTSYSNEEEEGLIDNGIELPFFLQDELEKLGGKYSCAPKFKPHVVEDGKLITGQNPSSSKEFAAAVLRALSDQHAQE